MRGGIGARGTPSGDGIDRWDFSIDVRLGAVWEKG
jgi:hypothetical protein